MAEILLSSPPPARPFSQQQIAFFYFAPCLDDNGEATCYFKCKVCGTTHNQVESRGFTNLTQKIPTSKMRCLLLGQGRPSLYFRGSVAKRRTVSAGLNGLFPVICLSVSVSKRTLEVYRETLTGDMHKVTRAVEEKISTETPEAFGLIFDGWTHDSEHFIAVFACYEIDGMPYHPLIAMAPVLEPPDPDADDSVITHNAEAHRDAFVLILAVFGKSLDQILFFGQ
ncbi:unnamed protein product [Phytophthora fragariaefolia]|uniref:Unnamed protein product n=1 Tax=Phytophthora fragariaefolia TaxID=1490495 RepID=A0A9W6XYB7_9STRA|nr:unnamed protein product [Phytophthora fragariaefolia]